MLQKFIKGLNKTYGWRKFRFGINIAKLTPTDNYFTLPENVREDWAFRYLIGGILCSHEREFKVLSATAVLFEKYPSIKSFARASKSEISDILYSKGIKRAEIKADWCLKTANDVVKLKKVPQTLEGLKAFSGVGEHVAEVVLSTVFNKNYFAIDTHVKRILGERMGVDLNSFKHTKEATGQLSRNLVCFGQKICAKEPKCSICPFKSECKFFNS